jgi:imidazolonepropionase-like amidohydrolase
MIPGLIDAHVHVEAWTPAVFLKYGVTTVRDLHSDAAFIFPMAREESASRPRIVTSGPLIDGAGSFWKNAVQVRNVGEARAAVRRQIEEGARVIKVYTRLEPALLSVIAAEARARNVPVAAHLGRTTATEAADAGVTSIEHLSGIADAASDDPERLLKAHDDFLGGWTAFELEWLRIPTARLEAVARQLIARGVVIVPTLAFHEAFSRLLDADLQNDPALADVPPEVVKGWDPADICGRARWTADTLARFKQVLPILERFVGTYAKLGGRIAAGTDTPQQFVVPGASLHRELELYVASGLSPAQALRSATAEAAVLLGVQDRVGVIDEGKAADFVLLDADPLTDIRNTRRIWMVVRDGVAVSR